jgi:hypothetical protein
MSLVAILVGISAGVVSPSEPGFGGRVEETENVQMTVSRGNLVSFKFTKGTIGHLSNRAFQIELNDDHEACFICSAGGVCRVSVLLALATPAQGKGYHAHTPIGNALNGTGYRDGCTLRLQASDLVCKPPPTHCSHQNNHIYIATIKYISKSLSSSCPNVGSNALRSELCVLPSGRLALSRPTSHKACGANADVHPPKKPRYGVFCVFIGFSGRQYSMWQALMKAQSNAACT